MDKLDHIELNNEQIIGAACNIACDHLDIFIKYLDSNNSIIITSEVRESIYIDLLPKLLDVSKEIIVRSEKL